MLDNHGYPYIIAEIGCNHNGDVELAKKMIFAAKDCGCQAIKLQLWQQEDLFTKQYLQDLNDGKIQLENIKEWKTKELGLNNIFDQVNKFAIYKDEHIELFRFAKGLGLDYASTVVTQDGVDFLIDQKVSFLKVASMDIDNLDFLDYIVSKDYPTVVSAGLASLVEIEAFYNIIPKRCRKNITLLHCVSLYPPQDQMVNLQFMRKLIDKFDLQIGYSDHTLGYSISLAAVALGAKVIEKHFTLDKNMPGWDHKVSANPVEMKIICEESKRIYDSLGTSEKELTEQELEKKLKFRRSLVTTRNIAKGEVIKEEDLTYKRPGTGLRPSDKEKILGKKAGRDIPEDCVITWNDVDIHI